MVTYYGKFESVPESSHKKIDQEGDEDEEEDNIKKELKKLLVGREKKKEPKEIYNLVVGSKTIIKMEIKRQQFLRRIK